MSKSLLTTFETLAPALKDALADLDSPLSLAFAALDIGHNEAGVDRMSAEHITACLEAAGVAVKKKSISAALARAGNRVSVRKADGREPHFKLMTAGKREIEGKLGGESLSVVRVEAGSPRTARTRLREVLMNLKGEVRICDPYYGVRTLDSLDLLPKSSNVRFLSGRTSETARKLQGAIRDFKKERPNVELRIAADPSQLHDRYVVTKDTLLILGHGLKDIGGKESFLIRLGKDLVPDLIEQLVQSFDERWGSANPI